MKKYLVVAFFIVAAAVAIPAQTPAPDAAELTKLLNWFLAGTNDPKVHEQFWADDLIYTRSSGVRTSKEEILKGMRSAAPKKDTDPITNYSADDVVIHQYGNVAIVAFKLVIQTKRADGTVGLSNNLNTGTFMKRGGKWQAIAWQSTVAPIKEDNSKPMLMTQPIKPAGLVAQPSASNSETARKYQKGPQGGCYYLTASGKKTYVDHKFCS